MRINKVIISRGTEEKLIAKHRVHAYEVEELFQERPRIEFVENGRVRGEDLYIALGQTEDKRTGVWFSSTRARATPSLSRHVI